MFIGRKAELQFLEERYASREAELIVLYGRRRVGKTELLNEFMKGKQAVFYTCTETPDREQLERFSKRVLASGIPAARYIQSFQDWESALGSVVDVPSQGKKILIIDEFPYMCRGNPAIPSILQTLWDQQLKRENVMIILCGSAMSFIEKQILGEKNPLYGRATGIYKLAPMSFQEAQQFFPGYSLEDKLAAYAILGGVPYYLSRFQPKKSLAENIKSELLQKGSVLYSEVEFLLRQELRESHIYNVIIEAVALGNNTLALIHDKTDLDKSKISVYLKNLMELGIIEREFSVLVSEKEKTRSQRGLYRLKDAYFKFWYTFVYGNLSELENNDVEGVYRYQVEPGLHEFISHAFEDVCIEYMRALNRGDALPFHFVRVGRWWDKVVHQVEGRKRTVTEEIDMMAFDREKKHFLLGECKYRHEAADIDVYQKLQMKYPLPSGAKACYVICFFFGFTDRMRVLAAHQPLRLVEKKELEEYVGTVTRDW